MSILEPVGIIAAVSFGAAGLAFGWRADQRAKTAEQIARDSNRIALESNRLSSEAVQIQRAVADDSRMARIRIREFWPLNFNRYSVDVSFYIVNDGEAHARQTSATVTQTGWRAVGASGVADLPPYSEQEVEAPLFFHGADGERVETDFIFRYRYADGLSDSHLIELCFHVGGLLGSDAGADWNLQRLDQCPHDSESQLCER